MKKKGSILLIVVSILIIFTLSLFAEEIKSTFQNEPDGFRGLKWGDAPTEDMSYFYQIKDEYIRDKGNYYHRIWDKLNIGNAKISSIKYIYNLYSNQFYKVNLTFYGKDNFDILKIICEGRFGEPTGKAKDWDFLRWVGDKAEVTLYLDKGCGLFSIKSMEIRIETLADKPEYNKQKEVEKAKEDF